MDRSSSESSDSWDRGGSSRYGSERGISSDSMSERED
jgi:hypothetical protein